MARITCGPNPDITSYIIEGLPGTTEALECKAKPDGSIDADIGVVPVGAHKIRLIAKNAWGDCATTDFDLVRPETVTPPDGIRVTA